MEGGGGRGAGGKQCQSRDSSLHIPPQSFVFTPLLKQFHSELSPFFLILVQFFVYFLYNDALMQAEVNGHNALNRP